jgi:hypothetical protein
VANPKVITCTFYNEDHVPAPCRTRDDLPTHVKGSAEWHQRGIHRRGYYIPQHLSPSNILDPVEFINNSWYGLYPIRHVLHTRAGLTIHPNNIFQLGYWNITDPLHPEYQPPTSLPPLPPTRPASCASFSTAQTSDSSESEGSSTASALSYQSIHEPNSPATFDPNPSIDSIVADLDTSVSLTGTLPLDPPTMSATTTSTPSTGFKGIAPNMFTGNRS